MKHAPHTLGYFLTLHDKPSIWLQSNEGKRAERMREYRRLALIGLAAGLALGGILLTLAS